jgi:hypothetical protein
VSLAATAAKVMREPDATPVHLFGSEMPLRADTIAVMKSVAAKVVQAESEHKEARWKLEQASRRDRAAQLDLGLLLVEARKAWPSRGPNAKGWGDFLAAIGVSQDSALRYMELARETGKISRTAGKAIAPGILKATRDFANRARQMVIDRHDAGFGAVVAAELRALADELEQAAERAAGAEQQTVESKEDFEDVAETIAMHIPNTTAAPTLPGGAA